MWSDGPTPSPRRASWRGQPLAGLLHQGAEPLSGVDAHDVELAVAEPAHAVEVDHRHGAVEGDRRLAHVVRRAEEAELLAGERDDDHAPARGAAPGQRLGESRGARPCPRRCRPRPGGSRRRAPARARTGCPGRGDRSGRRSRRPRRRGPDPCRAGCPRRSRSSPGRGGAPNGSALAHRVARVTRARPSGRSGRGGPRGRVRPGSAARRRPRAGPRSRRCPRTAWCRGASPAGRRGPDSRRRPRRRRRARGRSGPCGEARCSGSARPGGTAPGDPSRAAPRSSPGRPCRGRRGPRSRRSRAAAR